jgi:hypothetical protein
MTRQTSPVTLGILLLAFTGCTETVTPPPRPANVRESAVWAGGVDGGAWIDCRFSFKEPYPGYGCKTFNDNGIPWTAGTYVLAHVSRRDGAVTYTPAAALERAKQSEYVSFNGTIVELTGDRALVPDGTIDMPFPGGGGKRAEYDLGVQKSEVQYEPASSRP